MIEQFITYSGSNTESVSVSNGNTTQNSGNLINTVDTIPAGEHWYIDDIAAQSYHTIDVTDPSSQYDINSGTNSTVRIYDFRGQITDQNGNSLENTAFNVSANASEFLNENDGTDVGRTNRNTQNVNEYYTSDLLEEIEFTATWDYDVEENSGSDTVSVDFEYYSWVILRARRVDA